MIAPLRSFSVFDLATSSYSSPLDAKYPLILIWPPLSNNDQVSDLIVAWPVNIISSLLDGLLASGDPGDSREAEKGVS